MKKFFFFLVFALSGCGGMQASHFDTNSINIHCRLSEVKFCENRGGRVGNCSCIDSRTVESAVNSAARF